MCRAGTSSNAPVDGQKARIALGWADRPLFTLSGVVVTVAARTTGERTVGIVSAGTEDVTQVALIDLIAWAHDASYLDAAVVIDGDAPPRRFGSRAGTRHLTRLIPLCGPRSILEVDTATESYVVAAGVGVTLAVALGDRDDAFGMVDALLLGVPGLPTPGTSVTGRDS
jgi:hypothetical protein